MRAPLEHDFRVFVHFVDKDGAIVFQNDHDPLMPSSFWQGTIESVMDLRIPDNVLAGTSFELRVGLYDPQDGHRPRIEGPAGGRPGRRAGPDRIRG